MRPPVFSYAHGAPREMPFLSIQATLFQSECVMPSDRFYYI